jgi:hypothetical protein
MFRKWTDIESLSHVLRSRNQSHWLKALGPVQYRAKVKLHGTNAGVRIVKDGIFPQSRSQIISVQNDNAGFAIWLEANKSNFEKLWQGADELDTGVTVYGEWCGPGIQKSVAVNQIPHKVFAIFAMEFDAMSEGESGQFVLDPALIAHSITLNDSIRILPWASDQYCVDLDDPDSLASFAEIVNKMVAECETVDPWVRDNWNIEGPGEGFVWYGNPHDTNPYLKGLMFKAKGEAHRVNKTKSAATVNPDVLRGVAEFVEFSVTLPRLEQGLTEAVGGDANPEKTGDFLRWVMNDVIKECTPELADSGLTWKQVQGGVAKKARDWYLEQANKI